MAIIKLDDQISAEDIEKAKEEYQTYIKITLDIKQKVILIGGEYHADAEIILQEKYNSKQKHIWGGGYNLQTQKFETNALINLRPPENESMEIIDPKIRKKFLEIVNNKLKSLNKYHG